MMYYVCHSAESNCACAVWLRTLLPSVYSFSSGRCFQNLAQSKDGDGGEQPGVISCQMHRACACVCAISTPTQNLSLRPGDESEMLRNFRKNVNSFAIIQVRLPLAAHVQRKKRIHQRSSACFHSALLSQQFIDSLKPFSFSFFFSPANFIPLICLEWLQVPPLTALWGVQMMAEGFVQALWLFAEAERSRRTGGVERQELPQAAINLTLSFLSIHLSVVFYSI